MIKDTDWAYLAGVIDSDGCISLDRSKKHLHGRVTVTQSTKQPTRWLFDMFGGTYVEYWQEAKGLTPKAGFRYRWAHYSYEGVYLILEGCLPYLRLKNKRAKEVMDICRSRIPN